MNLVASITRHLIKPPDDPRCQPITGDIDRSRYITIMLQFMPLTPLLTCKEIDHSGEKILLWSDAAAGWWNDEDGVRN